VHYEIRPIVAGASCDFSEIAMQTFDRWGKYLRHAYDYPEALEAGIDGCKQERLLAERIARTRQKPSRRRR
jgi:hypothetical protein